MGLYKEIQNSVAYVTPKKEGIFKVYKSGQEFEYSGLDGICTGVSERTFESEKYQDKEQFVFHLQDDEQEIQVQLSRYSYYTLFLLNKIATLDKLDKLFFGIFADKNDNMVIYAKSNGAKITNRKFTPEQLTKGNAIGANKTEEGRNKAIDKLIGIIKGIPCSSSAFAKLESVMADDEDYENDFDFSGKKKPDLPF